MSLLPLRPAVGSQARCLFLSSERQIAPSLSKTNAGPPSTTVSPGSIASEVPSYLGYLSGAFNSMMTKGATSMGLMSAPAPDKKPVITQTGPTGAPVKAVSNDRVIQKVKSRSEVTTITRGLVKRIHNAESMASKLLRIQALSHHIMSYPGTRLVAAQDTDLIALLTQYEQEASEVNLRAASRMCLALCGYQPQVRSRGISMLSIDGGGTRGMMGLAVLEQIEKLSGKRVCELFDYICGVSTGGVIATLLGARKFTVAECRDVYMEISQKLFSQNRLQGVTGLIKSHSYYNTDKWISILKEFFGEEKTLIESARSRGVPRISLIASIVNLPVLEPYVFRNYEHPGGRNSHYRGGVNHSIWKAVQASAAAPFYFEEVDLNGILLQDGGIIVNNPTAIGIHESKLLWPEETLHCVVSIGNGRSVVELEPSSTVKSTNLQAKIARIIDSATDTEAVHQSMHDLLSHDTYYRLNPYMSFNYGLDEIDHERLNQMKNDAQLYVRRNMIKIEAAVDRLMQKPTLTQTAKRKLRTVPQLRGLFAK